MQVEVSVQDCYPANSQQAVLSGSLPATISATITEETWEIWFHRWLEVLSPLDAEEKPLHPRHGYELSLRLTDDREMQTLNAQYRHQDKPTDVLAFAALEVDTPQIAGEDTLPLYLGDIVISLDTAARQAQQQGHALNVELAWLAAHGLLHLLGWDHPDEGSLTKMLDQQSQLLQAVDVLLPNEGIPQSSPGR